VDARSGMEQAAAHGGGRWDWIGDAVAMASWIAAASLIWAGAPSTALGADFIAWSLMSRPAARRSWPAPARAGMLALVLAVALAGAVLWLARELRTF
jgi:hypothetical protein